MVRLERLSESERGREERLIVERERERERESKKNQNFLLFLSVSFQIWNSIVLLC